MQEPNERLVTLFCYENKSAGLLMRSSLNALCKVEAYHSNRKGDVIHLLEHHSIQLMFVAGSEEYIKEIYHNINSVYKNKTLADNLRTIIVAIPKILNTQSLNFLVEQGYDLILDDSYQLRDFKNKFSPLYNKLKARRLLANKLEKLEITEKLYLQIVIKFISDHRLVKLIFKDYIERKYNIALLEALYKKTNKISLLTELTHYFVEDTRSQRGLVYSAELLKTNPWSFRANHTLSKYHIAKSPEKSLAYFLKTDPSKLCETEPDFIFELLAKNKSSHSIDILNQYILARKDAILDLIISASNRSLYQPKLLRKLFVKVLSNKRIKINITKKISQNHSKQTGFVLSIMPILLAGKSYAASELIVREIRSLEDTDISPKEAVVYSLMFSLLGRNSYAKKITLDDNLEAISQLQKDNISKTFDTLEKEVKSQIKTILACNNADDIFNHYKQYPLSSELLHATCLSLNKLDINDDRFKKVINTSIFLETSAEKRDELRQIKSQVFK
ncbi:hypothetical protein MD588_15625 [Photobacterium sp. SDRW27]|uniref:hypothetical protein n=1 Tax=Photobacterium obscurum TaxID=2829490 RepID=UPI0022443BBD|nr:hypothetical protein [Photobacterium obscurum]MCW8330240.1 hypothetical protein [Photobacterium obscurum]